MVCSSSTSSYVINTLEWFFLIIENPASFDLIPLWNKNGVTMLSSLPSSPPPFLSSSFFSSSSEDFSCVLWPHLESFMSNQLPLKCKSTVTFSLISSLRASPSPSYKLCKSQRNNLTNLNQTKVLTPSCSFFCLALEGKKRTQPLYCTRLKNAAKSCIANIQIGCSCLHLLVVWVLWPSPLLLTENWAVLSRDRQVCSFVGGHIRAYTQCNTKKYLSLLFWLNSFFFRSKCAAARDSAVIQKSQIFTVDSSGI